MVKSGKSIEWNVEKKPYKGMVVIGYMDNIKLFEIRGYCSFDMSPIITYEAVSFLPGYNKEKCLMSGDLLDIKHQCEDRLEEFLNRASKCEYHNSIFG